jgi:predicted transcriptional regulator of viral defense system
MIPRSDVSAPGRRVRLTACCLGLWLAPAAGLRAQEEIKWEVPKERYTLDFASPAIAARRAFLPEGFAYEVPLNFVLFKRTKVTIHAKLPEAGKFDKLRGR